jgi:cell division protein FtsB
MQVSQLLCVQEQLEFDVAAQQAQTDELSAAQEALRAQVGFMWQLCAAEWCIVHMLSC